MTQGRTPPNISQVDEDGRQEDGVRREMLKLEAEIFQQQQKERGDRQPQAGENVRDEQHKFPGAQIAEGNRVCSNPPGSLRLAPAPPRSGNDGGERGTPSRYGGEEQSTQKSKG